MRQLVFIAGLTLIGCSNTPTVEYVPVIQAPSPLTCGSAPTANTHSPLEVKPQASQNDDGLTGVWLSPKSYENLAANLQATLAHLKTKNATIVFYRDCIAGFNDSLKAQSIKGGE